MLPLPTELTGLINGYVAFELITLHPHFQAAVHELAELESQYTFGLTLLECRAQAIAALLESHRASLSATLSLPYFNSPDTIRALWMGFRLPESPGLDLIRDILEAQLGSRRLVVAIERYLEQPGSRQSRLNLAGIRFTDLTPVSTLPRVNYLDLSRTPVTDLRPLIVMPGLTCLLLAYTNVTDLSPLLQMPGLTLVDLTGTPADRSVLAGLSGLEIRG
jgi:hypothetical protein